MLALQEYINALLLTDWVNVCIRRVSVVGAVQIL